MRTLVRAIILSAALVGAAPGAFAADLPVKAPPLAYAPLPNWSGFYIGGNIGGAWGSNSASFSGDAPTAVFFANNEFPTSLGTNPKGVIGGGQFGYNWQISPRWLIGLETDLQASSFKGSAAATPTPGPVPFVPFTTSVEEHSNWFGTLRGRVGFEPTPSLLLYGTAGLAYGQTETSFNAIATGFTLGTCPGNFTCTVAAASTTKIGWTAGAGAEWMFLPRWSVKAEYLYVDLGNQSATGTPTPGGVATFPNMFFTATAPFHESIVRVGINYHFDWGGPIVARY